MRRYLRNFLLLMLSGCTLTGGEAPSALTTERTKPPAAEVAFGRGFPGTDHHQHLFSSSLAEVVNGEKPKAAIPLPKHLAELLQARADRWNDRTALTKLYVKDSLVLGRSRSGWIRGAEGGVGFLTSFARAYYLTPVELRVVGPHAQIAGYYSRGDKAAPQHIGFFHMTVEKGKDGAWRIAQETPVFPFPPVQDPITAADIIKMLDEARITKAAILSEAFWFDSPLLPVDNPYPKVMAENDWTLSQVAQFPGRLVPFCSFNPVADHALKELERCAANPAFKGLKFSFAMSRVDLLNADHVARLKTVFAEANRRKLALVVHLTGGSGAGAEQVRIFLEQVMPDALDVPVQVAHLWGGEGFSEPALAALATAVEAHQPSSRNLYFDLAEVWTAGPSNAEAVAKYIRRIGLQRILYGSDAAFNGRLRPREAWRTLQTYLPMSDAEFRQIANNQAPYLN